MNRFFTSDIKEGKAYLSEDDAYHLKNVLRAKLGETFEVCNGIDREYVAELSYIDKKTAVLDIKKDVTIRREPKCEYIICQGIPKGRKLDDVIRHGTELGMSSFYPVITERINIKNIDDYDKTDRLQRIADEAAKQSKRMRIPVINKPIKFEELAVLPSDNALKIIAWEEETIKSLREVLTNTFDIRTVYIMVGPEGGLSREEVEFAMSKGWQSVTLGKRILRTETAPLTLLSAVSYHMGDLE